jgi:phosphate transport system substrate-binding protein
MKSIIAILILFFAWSGAGSALAQEASSGKIVITGVRFAYPLIEKWIADYKAVNPGADIRIEPRTVTDPTQYDLLIEAFEPDDKIKDTRDFVYLARYSLLPVANAKSSFAKIYADKGLTKDKIIQTYFNDVTASRKDDKLDPASYTLYTRLQKAGAPITFARYFGYQQANIKGRAIAGADEHLVKSLLKDSTGVSYGVPGLLYDVTSRKPLEGLVILPVDADNNGRVSDNEKFYDNLDVVLQKIEDEAPKNIPVEYLHLSIAKNGANPEALKFLKWVIDNGQDALHDFGFLKPEPKRFLPSKEKFGSVAIN